MKAPRKSTVENVYSKLKVEVIEFLDSELRFNRNTEGEFYGFNQIETELYSKFCIDMMEAIENTEINYSALVASYEDRELPF